MPIFFLSLWIPHSNGFFLSIIAVFISSWQKSPWDFFLSFFVKTFKTRLDFIKPWKRKCLKARLSICLPVYIYTVYLCTHTCWADIFDHGLLTHMFQCDFFCLPCLLYILMHIRSTMKKTRAGESLLTKTSVWMVGWLTETLKTYNDNNSETATD